MSAHLTQAYLVYIYLCNQGVGRAHGRAAEHPHPPLRGCAASTLSGWHDGHVLKGDWLYFLLLLRHLFTILSFFTIFAYVYLHLLHFTFQDRSIAVWDMVSPQEINLRRVLVGHRAAVNVVDFDDTYIVSASGDRFIQSSDGSRTQFTRRNASNQ